MDLKRRKSVSYKKAHYPGLDPKNPMNAVAYVTYPGNQIVFTGISDGKDRARGSTINFAEQIVMEIAKKEKVDPKTCTFFDLQTQKGYRTHKMGDYSFSRLTLTWNGLAIIRVGWMAGHCSEIILNDFGVYICGSDAKMRFRNLPQACGAIKPLPKGYFPNDLEDLFEVIWLVKEIAEKHTLTGLWGEFIEKLAEICTELCSELCIKNDDLGTIPRKTRFGEKSQPLFTDLCDWLGTEHQDFDDQLVPILFFE